MIVYVALIIISIIIYFLKKRFQTYDEDDIADSEVIEESDDFREISKDSQGNSNEKLLGRINQTTSSHREGINTSSIKEL